LTLWILIPMVIGAAAGALLAEPGDFWGNTLPSIATFAVLGLVVGLAAWGARCVFGRRAARAG
jgi:hypothetical protein